VTIDGSQPAATATSAQPAVVVGKAYDLALWLLPKIEKLPRSYRFSVGERITSAMLDVLTDLVEAAYTRDRSELLRHASRRLNALRLLVRLAKDLHLLSLSAYELTSEHLDEVGRMTGGWLRAEERRA
jgi:hypothetical protein